jgi:predicted nucleic acid-binding protein
LKYFLDTSSWIKRYCGEKGYEKVDDIILNFEVVIYDLEIVELISNLYRLNNESFLTKEELSNIISIIYKDIANFKVVTHSGKNIFDIINICEKSRQTAIDGIIISLAKEMDDITIITSDLKLKKGAELENIKVEFI